jgi:hypothetical protein
MKGTLSSFTDAAWIYRLDDGSVRSWEPAYICNKVLPRLQGSTAKITIEFSGVFVQSGPPRELYFLPEDLAAGVPVGKQALERVEAEAGEALHLGQGV